jgi:hypothetical protein
MNQQRNPIKQDGSGAHYIFCGPNTVEVEYRHLPTIDCDCDACLEWASGFADDVVRAFRADHEANRQREADRALERDVYNYRGREGEDVGY